MLKRLRAANLEKQQNKESEPRVRKECEKVSVEMSIKTTEGASVQQNAALSHSNCQPQKTTTGS